MEPKPANAFITTRKGFCYLTIKSYGSNRHLMRIRNYTLDAEDKRDMRRLYPDVVFDWKKIARQLAECRETCRDYRSRRRSAGAARSRGASEPLFGVFESATGMIYTNGLPSTARGMGRAARCRPADGPHLQGVTRISRAAQGRRVKAVSRLTGRVGED